MTTDLPKRFLPESLFPAARDEVIFGSGAYTIGVPSRYATRLMAEWSSHFVAHKLGELFSANYGSHYRTSIVIKRARDFDEHVKRAGYNPEHLTLPHSEEGQRQVLRQLAAVLRNPNLNLQEP